MSHPTVISGRLRIVFERRDDRWGHRVEWRDVNGSFVPLLESVEGSPPDQGVPSPPVQDLTMQETPDGGEVALGVGMSGRNHWSIACTPGDRALSVAADNCLTFGLACRLREDVLGLRSSYRLIAPVQVTRIEPRTVELTSPNVRLRIQSEETLIALHGGIAIVAETNLSQPMPYTRKWSYAIGGEPAGES